MNTKNLICLIIISSIYSLYSMNIIDINNNNSVITINLDDNLRKESLFIQDVEEAIKASDFVIENSEASKDIMQIPNDNRFTEETIEKIKELLKKDIFFLKYGGWFSQLNRWTQQEITYACSRLNIPLLLDVCIAYYAGYFDQNYQNENSINFLKEFSPRLQQAIMRKSEVIQEAITELIFSENKVLFTQAESNFFLGTTIEFNPKNEEVAVYSSETNSIEVKENVKSTSFIKHFFIADALKCMTFSSDGSLLAACTSDTIYIYNLVTSQETVITDIEGLTLIESLVFSFESNRLAVYSSNRLFIFDRQNWQTYTCLQLKPEHGNKIVFSPVKDQICTYGNNSYINFWSIRNGRFVTCASWPFYSIEHVVCSKALNILTTFSSKEYIGLIKQWQIDRFLEDKSNNFITHSVYSLASLACGSAYSTIPLLALLTGTSIILWNPLSKSHFRIIDTSWLLSDEVITKVAFCNNNRTLVAVTNKNYIKSWDLSRFLEAFNYLEQLTINDALKLLKEIA